MKQLTGCFRTDNWQKISKILSLPENYFRMLRKRVFPCSKHSAGSSEPWELKNLAAFYEALDLNKHPGPYPRLTKCELGENPEDPEFSWFTSGGYSLLSDRMFGRK
jgi:hypothetical protein